MGAVAPLQCFLTQNTILEEIMSILQEESYEKKWDLRLWKKVFEYMMPYKRYFVCVVITMMLIATVDGIFPLFTRYAIDNYIAKGKTEGILYFCLAYLAVILIQGINVYVMIMSAGRLKNICML